MNIKYYVYQFLIKNSWCLTSISISTISNFPWMKEVKVFDSGALIVTYNTILLSPRISAHLSPGHIFVRSLSYDMIFPWCNHPHISIRWLKYARPIYLFDERSCFWYVLKVVDGFHFTAFQTVFRRRTHNNLPPLFKP